MTTHPMVEATPEGASIGSNAAVSEAATRILNGESLRVPEPRAASAAEVKKILREVGQVRDDLVRQFVNLAGKVDGDAERVLRIVRKAATYRGRTRFDDPGSMAQFDETLRRLMAAGRRLSFVMPVGGGKAPNETKTGGYFLPDLTDWIGYAILSAIPESISRLYAPGAGVVIIPDAPLHTADLAFPYHEAITHICQLRRDLGSLGIDQHVQVVSTADHLPEGWSSEVTRKTTEARARMESNPLFGENLRDLARSLVFSINTRANSWSFDHSVLVSAALGGMTGLPPGAMADAEALRRRTWNVAPYYFGVNRALRTMNLPAVILRNLTGSPTYLRLTAHAKPGEPRPMLTQNSQRARPGLLPMHSLAFRFESEGRPRYSSIFEIEARHYGYRPVLDGSTGRFLFYEETDAAVSMERYLTGGP